MVGGAGKISAFEIKVRSGWSGHGWLGAVFPALLQTQGHINFQK
jgi:hypothetical protein